MTIVSDRNIPLLCQEVSSFPLIVLEDWNKWYSAFVLFPDGRVEKVSIDVIVEIEDKEGTMLYRDHNFHPKLLALLGKHYGAEVDWKSDEMATGRWVHEIENRLSYSPETV